MKSTRYATIRRATIYMVISVIGINVWGYEGDKRSCLRSRFMAHQFNVAAQGWGDAADRVMRRAQTVDLHNARAYALDVEAVVQDRRLEDGLRVSKLSCSGLLPSIPTHAAG